METERIIQVTKNNLDRLSHAKYSVDTRRRAHIRELAAALAKSISLSAEGQEELRHSYNRICQELSLSVEDRIALCRMMAEEYKGRTELFPILTAKRRCTLSYVKNPLTDLAYDSFSMLFDKAAVSYAEDFVSAVEDVYHSVTDYVILPVYSEKGGRLKSFCDLADKYELKKVMTCQIYSNTEDADTEFALYSKNCERFPGNRHRELCVEFSVPEEELLACLTMAKYREYNILSLNTVGTRTELCLELKETDMTPLLICLMLEMPGHEIKGIY